MSSKFRHKDVSWRIRPNDGGDYSWEVAHVAILMELRDELKKLNSLTYCQNFTGIPQTLKSIVKNTRRPRRKAAKK
jgi:hypothetical protein